MHAALTHLMARERMASLRREAELHRLAREASGRSRQHAREQRADVTAGSAAKSMGTP
jgi:hypothetical protein